jgi:predicted RND superfamily exporter protein
VLFSLWFGIAGVALYLHLTSTKINFLNFGALPITFGIGVDYAINVAQRHVEERRSNVAATLRTSGGAVVLCSLTTLLGYLALVGSHNRAIRSLGSIAAIGEISCLVGAVVVLPAVYEARSLWLSAFGERMPVRSSVAPPEP